MKAHATIYVQLLDEGVDVVRPIEAEILAGGLYRLLPPEEGYDPEVEVWEFPPGSVVECATGWRSHKDFVVADRLADLTAPDNAEEGSPEI
jgi:hypothetical protein